MTHAFSAIAFTSSVKAAQQRDGARRHRDGTTVMGLKKRSLIEVLDGRESTRVADWLQHNPSIRVVARSRARGLNHRASAPIGSAPVWH